MFLIDIWHVADEWKNFLARIGRDENALEGDLDNERDILELRFWASYRGQTLARTGKVNESLHLFPMHILSMFFLYLLSGIIPAVRGMMYYRKALMLQSYLERKAGSGKRLRAFL